METPVAWNLKYSFSTVCKAITAAQKNDRADAEELIDLLRVNLLPEYTMMPAKIRELRRILRYRNMIVRTAVVMKNKIAGLRMESGSSYNKQRLHGKRYCNDLLQYRLEDVPESVGALLRLNRTNPELFNTIQKELIQTLRRHKAILQRVGNPMTIPGVGAILALTWVVETGDIERFMSSRQVVSSCGLYSAQRKSAEKEQRGPLSRKRNNYLQTILIEAAKLAPCLNPQLHAIHERALQKGNRNRAPLDLVKYLLAVDRRGTSFIPLSR
jgi:transposase